MPARDTAALVEEEDAVEVPLDVTRELGLGKLPHHVGVGTIHLHLGHHVAARNVGRHALALSEAAHLRLGQLLRAKLVGRENQYLEARAKLLVELAEELIAARR